MKKIPYILLVIIVFVAHSAFCQIDDIHRNVEKDKNSSPQSDGNSNSFESDDSNTFGEEMILLMFKGMYLALMYGNEKSLENVEDFPERRSLEAYGSFGIDYNRVTECYVQTIKGNYGIFSTELSFKQLRDISENINTVDWQVIKFRIPIHNVVPEFGFGFSYLPQHDYSYFESSLALDWYIRNPKITISPSIRSTAKGNSGSKFRRMYSIRADYELVQYRIFHASPFLEYSYHDYFSETNFSVFSLGIMFRLY